MKTSLGAPHADWCSNSVLSLSLSLEHGTVDKITAI